MNFGEEPIIAAVVNVIVSLLVSKGIIDSTHAPLLSQEINNTLAALVTLGLGGYSIYKTVEAYKHKVTVNGQLTQSQISNSLSSVPSNNSSITEISTAQPKSQTGLPLIPSNG